MRGTDMVYPELQVVRELIEGVTTVEVQETYNHAVRKLG
jgi:hypothetical protein